MLLGCFIRLSSDQKGANKNQSLDSHYGVTRNNKNIPIASYIRGQLRLIVNVINEDCEQVSIHRKIKT